MKFECECCEPKCQLEIDEKYWLPVRNKMSNKFRNKVSIRHVDCISLLKPGVKIIKQKKHLVIVKNKS